MKLVPCLFSHRHGIKEGMPEQLLANAAAPSARGSDHARLV
jgi:hypothetical protein